MESCDENKNLMSTLLPIKNCPCAASKISVWKEEYLAILSMISLINHDLIMK